MNLPQSCIIELSKCSKAAPNVDSLSMKGLSLPMTHRIPWAIWDLIGVYACWVSQQIPIERWAAAGFAGLSDPH